MEILPGLKASNAVAMFHRDPVSMGLSLNKVTGVSAVAGKLTVSDFSFSGRLSTIGNEVGTICVSEVEISSNIRMSSILGLDGVSARVFL